MKRDGRGLEIGPSYNPIAPKRAGFNVEILDHASASELRSKYAPHRADISLIEEVDYLWKGEPLDELTGKQAYYDWIIAAHVIEHTPDMIAFLSQCERMLVPDGVLSLVIPDKRYCFDLFQPLTTTGAVLQARHERRTRHTPGNVFDQFAYATSRNGSIAWSEHDRGELKLLHTLDDARHWFDAATSETRYIDVHSWKFTPSSFRLLMADLNQLNLIALKEACFFPTVAGEFFVTLSKRGNGCPMSRFELASQAMKENGEAFPFPAGGFTRNKGSFTIRDLFSRSIRRVVPLIPGPVKHVIPSSLKDRVKEMLAPKPNNSR